MSRRLCLAANRRRVYVPVGTPAPQWLERRCTPSAEEFARDWERLLIAVRRAGEHPSSVHVFPRVPGDPAQTTYRAERAAARRGMPAPGARLVIPGVGRCRCCGRARRLGALRECASCTAAGAAPCPVCGDWGVSPIVGNPCEDCLADPTPGDGYSWLDAARRRPGAEASKQPRRLSAPASADWPWTRTVGVEIEVDTAPDITAPTAWAGFWWVHSDGSVPYGCEYSSPILVGGAVPAELRRFASALRASGARVRRARSSAGLHVWLGCPREDDAARIVAAWAATEAGWFELVPPRRRHNTYCSPSAQALFAAAPAPERWNRCAKYASLTPYRWGERGALEVRIGQSSTHPERIVGWVAMLAAFAAWSESRNECETILPASAALAAIRDACADHALAARAFRDRLAKYARVAPAAHVVV